MTRRQVGNAAPARTALWIFPTYNQFQFLELYEELATFFAFHYLSLPDPAI